MSASKIIQAGPRIAEILKAIARSEQLFTMTESVTAGFNFNREFSAARVPDGINRISLRYPENKDAYIAFVFGLLMQFDADASELARFLQDYYFDDEGINSAYSAFLKEVVPKFKRSVMSKFDRSVSVDDVKRKPALGHGDVEYLSGYISSLINAVSADGGLDLELKEEYLLTTSALKNCIIRRDYDYVIALYIGVINTFTQKEGYREYLEQIGKMLRRCNLI
jgi:hypothetical protein